MTDITTRNMDQIFAARDTIKQFAEHATMLHRDAIAAEIAAFDARREEHPTAWAQLCIIKSLLSPGADLDPNIAFARILHDALRGGQTIATYDDAEQYRAACKYGARSVGKNIVRTLVAWTEKLSTMSPEDMSWETLSTWNNGKHLSGHSLKTRSWSLALYNARSDVFTIDVHIARGVAALAGLDCSGIADAAYVKLQAFLLDIAREIEPDMPLIVQWAMWNEIRHAGTHASHIALAR